MSTYGIIKKLCDERGLAVTALERELGFGRGSIGKLRNGGSTSVKRLQDIAGYFGVTLEYLTGEEEEAAPVSGLTPRDERDISRLLERTLKELENEQDALMFDGEPLDDVTRELLAASLRNSMEIGKRLAKEKYTPKKHRK